MRPPIPKSLLLAALVAVPAAHAPAQSCLIPDAGTDAVRFLWGGEMRQIEVVRTTESFKTWVVGDGGRILHRPTHLSPWEFQATPSDLTQTLLDVYFADPLNGWACGWANRILKTTDGGATWENFGTLPEWGCDGPSTLWRSRFLDADFGFVCGLWVFEHWNGSQWGPVELWDRHPGQPDPVLIDDSELELYALEILEIDGEWIGVAAAEWWDKTSHCPDPEEDESFEGVVFYTDSRDPASNGGTTWWMTFHETAFNLATTGKQARINDPWDMEFSPDADDLDTAVLYVAGGTGNALGSVLRSNDGGKSDWSVDFRKFNLMTFYGMTVFSDEEVVVCGYGGDLYRREDTGGVLPATWTDARPTTRFSGPLADAHALPGEVPACMLTGSWGFLRETADVYPAGGGNPDWVQQIPGAADHSQHWRLEDVRFVSDTRGFAVGQHAAVLETCDGGCTWTGVYGGPPPGGAPKNKMRSLAFSADGSVGVAVGSMKLGQGTTEYAALSGVLPACPDLSSWTAAEFVPALGTDVLLRSVTRLPGDVYLAVGNEGYGGSGDLLLFIGVFNPDMQRVVFVPALSGPSASRPPDDFRALDVVAVAPNEAIVVGSENLGGTVPKAYYLDLAAQTSTEVSVVPPLGAIVEIDSRGTTRPVEAYAVGAGNNVLQYSENGPPGFRGEFTALSGVPALPAPLAYVSIAAAPDGPDLLVGTSTASIEANTEDVGKLLHFDGARWNELRSLTNEEVPAIFLRTRELGWFLGDSSGVGLDTEFGSVGDTVFLKYEND